MRILRTGIGLGMTVAVAALMLAPAGLAKDKDENAGPFVWGMQSGNSGCVIFKESQRIDSVMSPGGGGFTTQTVKTLEVIDAIHATLPEKKYSETQEDLAKLQDLSIQNHWKYIKIPKKYSPADLDKAKSMCGVQ